MSSQCDKEMADGRFYPVNLTIDSFTPSNQ